MKARTVETLWAELSQAQQEEMQTLAREREELEKEKAAMNSLPPNASGIVTIDAGGEIIRAHRDTLCLVSGSVFAGMFSGRWEDRLTRDADGRIFLDHDPEHIRLIVNYLRVKRIEDPSNPLPPPRVPKDRRKEWVCLLKYFGLDSFFGITEGITPWWSEVDVVQPHGSDVSWNKVEDRLELVSPPLVGFRFLACTPCLPESKGAWKVTINELDQRGWLYLGVIGNTNADRQSYRDRSSFGWAFGGFGGQVIVRGTHAPSPGFCGFFDGESLHFILEGGTLTMISLLKKTRFVIRQIPEGDMFIHFNFHAASTKITLEELRDDERAESASYN